MKRPPVIASIPSSSLYQIVATPRCGLPAARTKLAYVIGESKPRPQPVPNPGRASGARHLSPARPASAVAAPGRAPRTSNSPPPTGSNDDANGGPAGTIPSSLAHPPNTINPTPNTPHPSPRRPQINDIPFMSAGKTAIQGRRQPFSAAFPTFLLRFL